jgi:hypothetical protein
MPKPQPASLDTLYTGREDSNWVQAEGYVAAVGESGGTLQLTVVEGVHTFVVYVTTPAAWPATCWMPGCGWKAFAAPFQRAAPTDRHQAVRAGLEICHHPQAGGRQHGGYPRNAHLQPAAILARGAASRSRSRHADAGRCRAAPHLSKTPRRDFGWRRLCRRTFTRATKWKRRAAGSGRVLPDSATRRGAADGAAAPLIRRTPRRRTLWPAPAIPSWCAWKPPWWTMSRRSPTRAGGAGGRPAVQRAPAV